jgi:hypothetical protein
MENPKKFVQEGSNIYISAALAEVALQAMLMWEEVSHIYNVVSFSGSRNKGSNHPDQNAWYLLHLFWS